MLTRRDTLRLAGGALGLVGPTEHIFGQSPKPLRVVGFAGASNLPLWIGQERGFFVREGVNPEFEITPNSVEMVRNLYAGRFDLAMTSIDNVVAYDEEQGEAGLTSNPDFVALFGIDDAMLSLVAAPEVKSIADLKGKTVSVDAMTTGFAFVLRSMLAKAGLSESEVVFSKVGGGAQRLQALLKGEQAATLLNAPLDSMALSKGFVRLATARSIVGPLQGGVGMTRRDTAARLANELEAFIRGFRESIRWLSQPENRADAAECIVRHMRLSQDEALQVYDRVLDPSAGIFRDMRVNREGVDTVLRLRSAYGIPRKLLNDPDRYVDESYLFRALNR
jgi:ABC-type nitrate/sulfonate/bicarbonate transport system substrate-binding protein